MRVRVLRGVRGPDRDLRQDEVLELDELAAKLLISTGAAGPAGESKRRGRPPVEQATAAPGEKRRVGRRRSS
jgi:hypothetical protein